MEEDVRVYGNARDLSERAAAAIVELIAEAARRQGRCPLILSGGNTPRALYRLLASKYRDQVPWSQVHVDSISCCWASEQTAIRPLSSLVRRR